MPLLAWALIGDHRNTDNVAPLFKPAMLRGYSRFSLIGKDYPAALVKHDEDSVVNGLLFHPRTKSQWLKLDNFKGEVYVVAPVQVSAVGEEENEKDLTVEADVYLWNGDRAAILTEPWSLEAFIRERLDVWIEIFSRMEADRR